jgi:hypothetical protein
MPASKLLSFERSWVLAIAATALASVACAGPMEVREVVSPAQASAAGVQPRMRVEAIEVDGARVALPIGATVERDGLHTEGRLEHLTAPGDELLTDGDGVLIGVRASDGSEVHFQPGTASVLADRVVGQGVAGPPTELPEGARAVVVGRFAPGEEIPVGGAVESRRATPLVVIGTTVFALGYLPSVVVAAESKQAADGWLAVPVVGPWIDLAKRPNCTPPAGTPEGLDPCKPEAAARVAVLAVGVVQGIGALTVLFGLPSHSVHVGRDGREREGRGPGLSVGAAPWVLPGGGGATLGGQF